MSDWIQQGSKPWPWQLALALALAADMHGFEFFTERGVVTAKRRASNRLLGRRTSLGPRFSDPAPTPHFSTLLGACRAGDRARPGPNPGHRPDHADRRRRDTLGDEGRA